MVHGFNADKNHWLYLAAHLRRFRLIIPDLGGHGQSRYDGKITYDIPCQVALLHKLLSGLHIGNFHLAGHSMGGWVAAYYTSEFPGQIKTLGLFSAAGVVSPRKSEFFSALGRDRNYFFSRIRRGSMI